MIQFSIECDPIFLCPNSKTVCRISKTVLNSHGAKQGEISIIFGSDELLSSLKKEFFHKDHWTDVIAFRLNDYEKEVVEGELYISLPRAKENSETYNEPFEKEVARLIIHGSLHLLGFQDDTEKTKTEMTELENEYLNQINWNILFET